MLRAYGSVGKEVRREDGRKDRDLTEPHPTGNPPLYRSLLLTAFTDWG